jgi:hypothetical protein
MGILYVPTFQVVIEMKKINRRMQQMEESQKRMLEKMEEKLDQLLERTSSSGWSWWSRR